MRGRAGHEHDDRCPAGPFRVRPRACGCRVLCMDEPVRDIRRASRTLHVERIVRSHPCGEGGPCDHALTVRRGPSTAAQIREARLLPGFPKLREHERGPGDVMAVDEEPWPVRRAMLVEHEAAGLRAPSPCVVAEPVRDPMVAGLHDGIVDRRALHGQPSHGRGTLLQDHPPVESVGSSRRIVSGPCGGASSLRLGGQLAIPGFVLQERKGEHEHECSQGEGGSREGDARHASPPLRMAGSHRLCLRGRSHAARPPSAAAPTRAGTMGRFTPVWASLPP